VLTLGENITYNQLYTSISKIRKENSSDPHKIYEEVFEASFGFGITCPSATMHNKGYISRYTRFV
jgi:hypothetical protein